MRMRKLQILLFYLMWLFLTSGLLPENDTLLSSTLAAGVPDETGGIPTFNPAETPPPPSFSATTTTSPPPPPPSFSGTTTTPPQSGGGSWCTASQTASPTALQVALDYACGYGGADCSSIQPGGSCSDPDTLRDHASFAFNDYYQKNPTPTSCVFGGAAQLTFADPSSGNCHYSSTPSSQAPPPPPSLTSPVTPSNQGGPSVYGMDPTDSGSDKNLPEWLIILLFPAMVLALLFRREKT